MMPLRDSQRGRRQSKRARGRDFCGPLVRMSPQKAIRLFRAGDRTSTNFATATKIITVATVDLFIIQPEGSFETASCKFT
jgi:hypothetical protein